MGNRAFSLVSSHGSGESFALVPCLAVSYQALIAELFLGGALPPAREGARQVHEFSGLALKVRNGSERFVRSPVPDLRTSGVRRKTSP
jgi:hypothetical protein